MQGDIRGACPQLILNEKDIIKIKSAVAIISNNLMFSVITIINISKH